MAQTQTEMTQDTVDEIQRLAKPEHFEVWVGYIGPELSQTQYGRLGKLLEIVKRHAEKQAANMLKGVIKYPDVTDHADRDPFEWFDHTYDELVDALNTYGIAIEALDNAVSRGDYDGG